MQLRKWLVLAAVLGVAAGWGQGDVLAVLAGKAAPLSLPAKALAGGTWFQLKVGGQPGGTDVLLMMASQGQQGLASVVFYTKGQTVGLGGETFLIAYQVPRLDLQRVVVTPRGQAPPPGALTPETQLTLSLLNLRTCGNLLDIKPFDKAALSAAPQPAINPPPGAENDARLKALRNQSIQQLRQLAMALQMYVPDHNRRYPKLTDAASLKAAIIAYLGGAEHMFVSPNGKPYLPNPWLSERREAEVPKPSETVTVYESTAWPDGRRGVGFADGHASMVDEATWQELKQAAGIP